MPGTLSAWASVAPDSREINVVDFKNSLDASYEKQMQLHAISENEIIPNSAVLVPLVVDEETKIVDKIVFIKRPAEMRNYSGHVAFPGGHKDDADDTFGDCALRETFEEIGIASKNIEILGRSKFARTKTANTYIAPIVGTINKNALSNMVLSKEEVQTVHVVKLAELLAPDNYYCEIWDSPEISMNVHIFMVKDDQDRPVFIWGASAQILYDILSSYF